ncbi:putative E3 ubiquitin-protein ligase ATL44 [Curcuma longa]|uniref:putative E3 ubiquitin-protein ligase ATL44 n=1 Tax=Curcuma longa TaxID=136217 RepID=UPI003D9E82CD
MLLASSLASPCLSILVVAAALPAALLLAGLSVLAALQACTVARVFRRPSASAGCRGLSTEELRSLPCYAFRPPPRAAAAAEEEAEQCAVCLERFGAGERCRLLPLCRHSFHAQCVDPWLLNAPVCPICRTRAAAAAAAAKRNC